MAEETGSTRSDARLPSGIKYGTKAVFSRFRVVTNKILPLQRPQYSQTRSFIHVQFWCNIHERAGFVFISAEQLEDFRSHLNRWNVVVHSYCPHQPMFTNVAIATAMSRSTSSTTSPRIATSLRP